jgi:PAS domain S-box-containing protein
MREQLSKLSPLGWRLVTATVAFSTCVALLATGLQLYFDYRNDLQDIESTFEQVDKTHLPTIANALWSTNRHEVQVAIDGLARLPDVQHVTVQENGKTWAQAGRLPTSQTQSRDFALTFVHRGDLQTIGNLIVAIDMEGVYQRLINRFWVIFITNSIKAFIVAGFMLWLFHVLVTRHLKRIAAFASRLGVENLQERLDLARPPRPQAQPDEFDLLLQAFGRMQSTLASSLNALRDSEARFRVMFEQAAVGVAQIHTETGKFLRVNQKYCDITGYSQDELRQLDVQAVTQLDDMQIDGEQLRLLKIGSIREYALEQRYLRKDGSLVWIHLTVSPMWLEGGPLSSHIAVVQDITERKRAEAEVRQLNAELEQRVADRTAQLVAMNQEAESFSYSVSHDLRTPLRAIDGFCQVLSEDYGQNLDADGNKYLSRVRAAAQRMGMLIDDMLQLALIARLEINFTPIDLSALAEEVAAGLREQIVFRSTTFAIQPGLDIKGDVSMLRIVLENLLGNAAKYSSKSPQPQVELGSVLKDGRSVYFVRDNGAGFDMAFVGKLFGAFQRLHRSEDYPGTGIGLATVKRIVNRHGGEVWAEGRPGEGAVFYFTFGASGRSNNEKLRRVG